MEPPAGDPDAGRRHARSPLEAEPDFELRIQHPVLHAILAAWRGAHRGETPPRRADVTPARLRGALPHVVLVDVAGEPPRYRWRLIGTHLTQLLGRDRTGRWIDELYAPAAVEVLSRTFAMSLIHAVPIRFTGTFAFLDKAYFAFESVHLPLVDDGGRIAILLLGVAARPAKA